MEGEAEEAGLYWRREGGMAASVTLSDLQEHLGDVVARVEGGEEIVVERDGRAAFRLVPAAADGRPLEPRVGGQNFLGITYIAPDFYDPMTEEELAEWGLQAG